MNHDLVERIRKMTRGDKVPRDDELVVALQELGLDYDAESFELIDPPELLDEKWLQASCEKLGNPPQRLEVHFTIGSTNTRQLDRADADDFHASICLAERQESGKGRRGRSWISPFGRNIYMSVGWCVPRSRSLTGLSIAVGMAIAGALRDAGIESVGLKWPNDLMLGDGKLGGILIEVATPSASHHRVVIGCGLNLRLDARDALQIDQPFSTVLDHLSLSRNLLVSKLLASLLPALEIYNRHGFARFATGWPDYDVFAGAPVFVTTGDRSIEGENAGIDTEGNLRLRTAEGIRSFNAGEVSLRKSSS